MNGVCGREVKGRGINRTQAFILILAYMVVENHDRFSRHVQSPHTHYQALPNMVQMRYCILLKGARIFCLAPTQFTGESHVGFLAQPNLWQCGPYALKHALIMLGILVDEHEISSVAATDASGTDEKNLARAARNFGCRLLEVRMKDAVKARRELTESLDRGNPCLICVHQWMHWVVIVRKQGGRFILLDSEDAAVLTIVTWNELEEMWAYEPAGRRRRARSDTLYDLYPLVPQFRVQLRAKFSIARARFLRRPENRQLAQQWDEYLEDLLQVCKPRTPLSENVISLGEFLRRHGAMIVNQIAYWHGGIERKAAEKVLQNMRFVADTHGLIVHRDDEKRAISGLTAVLTLWAGSKYGVGPVYQGHK